MRTSISFFISALLIAFVFTGCKNDNKLAENPLTFSAFKLEKRANLFNDTLKPGCHLILEMKYPSEFSDQVALKKLQGSLLSSYIGEEYSTLAPEAALEKYAADYLTSYMELESSYDPSNNEEGGGNMWLNYEQFGSSAPIFNQGGFLSNGISIYTYTGGAHGITSNIFQIYNLKDMSVIKLSDLIADRNLDAVSELIKSELAKQNDCKGIDELEELGYDVNAIIPTENFYINENGITWQYNQYEIAAYAMGAPKVTIPFEDLQLYVKEDSPLKSLIEILSKNKPEKE